MKLSFFLCLFLPAYLLGQYNNVDKYTSLPHPVLQSEHFKHYIDTFNSLDDERYKGYIPNNRSWDFLSQNIPLLDCPDKTIEQTYYFRWWTYRKHIKQTPDGFIISEFHPDVPWAGKYNAISCPAAFHFSEGRWLADQQFLNAYAHYWFEGGGSPRAYSFWAAYALYQQFLVTGDTTTLKQLMPHLIQNYEAWEKEKLDNNGIFWQIDDRDGMEVSIGGSGYRATINSYMYGDARALSAIARMLGDDQTAARFDQKATRLKSRMIQLLWDPGDSFFKVRSREPGAPLSDARELHGYTPWYFNLPDNEHSAAWKYLMDARHFYAPYGPTTADQQHPGFTISYEGHECKWNGPSWPFATSITLTALTNLLNNYDQSFIDVNDFYKLLYNYAYSHQRILESGKRVPWIDENLNPYTGDWISRTVLKSRPGFIERGKDYNHSTFCDLVISGLLGIRPESGNKLTIHPLTPETWDYYCLDKVPYKGKKLTILYDRTGEKYGKGKGFQVFVNGKKVHHSPAPGKINLSLPVN